MKNRARLHPRIAELERLIAGERTKEEALHQAVIRAPGLLAPFGGPFMVTKPRIGPGLVADFAARTVGNYEFWTFLEIERANVPLFTRSGRPSKHLTQALWQVAQWEMTLQIGGHGYEGGYTFVVVIGRRKDLTLFDQKAIRQENETRIRQRIMTWDALLDPVRRGVQSAVPRWAQVITDAQYRRDRGLGDLPVWDE